MPAQNFGKALLVIVLHELRYTGLFINSLLYLFVFNSYLLRRGVNTIRCEFTLGPQLLLPDRG